MAEHTNKVIKDFKKNIAFTSLVKVGGRLREFNFRKRGDSFYDVDISDERGNRYFFKMENREGSWKINDTSLPGWLVGTEDLLHEAIQKQEQQISYR